MLNCNHPKEKIVMFPSLDIEGVINTTGSQQSLKLTSSNLDYEGSVFCGWDLPRYNLLFAVFYWCSCCGARFAPRNESRVFYNYVNKHGYSVFSKKNICVVNVPPIRDENFFAPEDSRYGQFWSENLDVFAVYVPSSRKLEGIPPLYVFGGVWMAKLNTDCHVGRRMDGIEVETEFMAPIKSDGHFCRSVISNVDDMLSGKKYSNAVGETLKCATGKPIWDAESGSVVVIKKREDSQNAFVDKIHTPEYLMGKGRMAFFKSK